MNGKMFSLPIKNVNFSNEVYDDGQLKKVTLMVCAEGLVEDRGIFIEKSAIQSAIDNKSLYNKPILCAYEVDNEGNKTDFQGHEIDYKIIKDGTSYSIKIEYREQPVGVIPESCNARFETIDSKEWLMIDAYLYSVYCEDAIRILEESDGKKSVSMEVKFLDTNESKDGVTHINDFAFKGITLLGEENPPAIEGANIGIFSQTDTFAEQFEKLIQRVNKLEGKGGQEVNREEIIAKYQHLKGLDNFQLIIDKVELSDSDLEKELFSLSINDLRSRVREKLKEVTYSYTDWWGDTYEWEKYYLYDVLFEENRVVVEDNENYCKYYGIPYTKDGDEIILNFDEMKRVIRGDWRDFIEGSTEVEVNPLFSEITNHNTEKAKVQKESFENVTKELKEVKTNFKELKLNNEKLESDFEEIKKINEKFTKAERDIEIETVMSKFSAEITKVDGYKEVFEKRYELSIENFTKEIGYLAISNDIAIIDNKKKNNGNFSKGNVKVPVPGTHNNSLSEAEKRYGTDIINKYKN